MPQLGTGTRPGSVLRIEDHPKKGIHSANISLKNKRRGGGGAKPPFFEHCWERMQAPKEVNHIRRQKRRIKKTQRERKDFGKTKA